MTPFDRLFKIMINPWVVFSYFGLIILSILYFDIPIAYYFHVFDLKSNLLLLNWLAKFGLGMLYLVLFFVLALFFRYFYCNKKWEERVWFLWLCIFIPNIICLGLKIILGRALPVLLFSKQEYGFYGFQLHADYWAFPSGHTTTIMGLVFGLSILFPRYFYAFIVSGFALVFSRIILTHHYFSDVMIAFYLTLLEVGVLFWWLRRNNWLIGREPNQGVS